MFAEREARKKALSVFLKMFEMTWDDYLIATTSKRTSTYYADMRNRRELESNVYEALRGSRFYEHLFDKTVWWLKADTAEHIKRPMALDSDGTRTSLTYIKLHRRFVIFGRCFKQRLNSFTYVSILESIVNRDSIKAQMNAEDFENAMEVLKKRADLIAYGKVMS